MLWSKQEYAIASQLLSDCDTINSSDYQYSGWPVCFYADPGQSIWWHVLSPYLVALVLFLMIISVIYEFYTFRAGGYSLAQQMGARRLNQMESIPEESAALRINTQLADTFLIEPPAMYVLPNEVGSMH